MSVGELSVGELSVGEMSVGELSVGELSVGELSVGEMSWIQVEGMKPSQLVYRPSLSDHQQYLFLRCFYRFMPVIKICLTLPLLH